MPMTAFDSNDSSLILSCLITVHAQKACLLSCHQDRRLRDRECGAAGCADSRGAGVLFPVGSCQQLPAGTQRLSPHRSCVTSGSLAGMHTQPQHRQCMHCTERPSQLDTSLFHVTCIQHASPGNRLFSFAFSFNPGPDSVWL